MGSMARGSDEPCAARFPLTGKFMAGRMRESLDAGELVALENLVERERTLRDGEVHVARSALSEESAVLVEGFLFRTICEGGRRHIVGLHVPGDFVNPHAFALARCDHDVVAAGRARIGIVPRARLEAAIARWPGLARSLWLAVLLDAAIQRKWTQVLGHLDAPRRIAHVYCELQHRLGFVGEASAHCVRTPFTQFDLGDMCGVSTVHANRAVGKLRASDLAEIRRGTLYTRDWAALRQYARFEPGYLHAGEPATASPRAAVELPQPTA
jgi:CRP-like cAMP-binding protein